MFEKLRRRLWLLSTVILGFVIFGVMVIGYMLSTSIINRQIILIADEILENGGHIPYEDVFDSKEAMLYALTLETLYETRYFSVSVAEDDTVTIISKDSIVGVSEEDAGEFALRVAGKHAGSGRISEDDGSIFFYHKKTQEDGSTLVVFVDMTNRYWLTQVIFLFLSTLWFGIIIIFAILMGIYSKQLVQPFVENDARQKRFITNASHELKTPVAVISANTEMMEAMGQGGKWVDSNKRQLTRLQRLIEELVTLSRLNEMKAPELSELDLSAMARETAEGYQTLAQQEGKGFELRIEEGLQVHSEKRALTEIMNILLDNAVKYCDDQGTIRVSAFRSRGKGVKYVVANTYAAGRDEDLSKFFERFYRQDESHNSKKSGFGIGLSMAKELSRKLRGNLSVSYGAGTGAEPGEIRFTLDLS